MSNNCNYFRSMGIVLPPLPPSTYCGSHQRNRSLDSVLQKIPEVEPNEPPDTPPVIPALKPSLSFTFSDAPSFKLRSDPCRTRALLGSVVSATTGTGTVPVVVKRCKDRFDNSSLGSDDSGICSSEPDNRETSAERGYCLDTSDCEENKSVYSETLDMEDGDGVSDSGDMADRTLVEDANDASPSDNTITEATDSSSPLENSQGCTPSPLDPSQGHNSSLPEHSQVLTPSPEPCIDLECDTTRISTCEHIADTNDLVASNNSTDISESSSSVKSIVIDKCAVNCESLTSSSNIITSSQSSAIDTNPNANIATALTINSGTSCKLDEKQSLLLRLFESKLFDMSMAVSYLFKCKEPGVQQYIGNRLFSLPVTDTYFYLPQLVNMYVQTYEVAEVLHPFLTHLCRYDTVFALQCSWLLDAFATDTAHQRKKSHGAKFMNKILSDELRLVFIKC